MVPPMGSADERTDAGRPGDGDDPLSLLLAAFAAPGEPPAADPGPPAPAAEDLPLPEPELPAPDARPPSLTRFLLPAGPEPPLPEAEPPAAFDEPPLLGHDPLPEPLWADAAPADPPSVVELPSFTELIGQADPAPDPATATDPATGADVDLPEPDSLGSSEELPEAGGRPDSPQADRPAERTDHTEDRPEKEPADATPPAADQPDFPALSGGPDTDPYLGVFAGEGPVEEPDLDGAGVPAPTADEEAFGGWAPELPDLGGAAAPVAPSSLLSDPEFSLAAVPPADVPAGEQHLVFTLAGAEYAALLADVLEIGHPPRVTPVPHVPGWVLGVGSVRGDIVSVVDLGAFLGLPGERGGRPGRFVVARGGPGGVSAGLVVDEVREIFRLTPEQVGPLPGGDGAAVEDAVRPYLRGLTRHAGRALRVLDLGLLLNSDAMRQFEPV
jgi:purine-binding chemotaxis protein CheW